MSFSRPGPKRDDALSAVVGGKGLDARDGLVLDDSDLAELDEETPGSAGPTALQRLLMHEKTRLAALGAGDKRVADEVVPEVISDLEMLLSSAASVVRASDGGRRTRKQVKKAAPRLAALDDLPLPDVAEFLGLKRSEVDGVLTSLVVDRDQVLVHLEQLKLKVRELKTSRDHSMLSGLVGFVVKVFLLIAIPLDTEDPVLAETIRTAILALVAIALRQAVETVRDWFAEREPLAVAERAREDLLAELTLAKSLTKAPAHEGEHTVLRFRLHVRCAAARITSIPLDWPEKPQYWQLLDQIALALDHDAPKTLVLIRRKLESTPVS
ncbi:hypothetical protein [Kribbella sp. NPDC006257]|uniref:hypothetical protein n=1 Tax=Kribbella sp. NPDC006257 TaxID=3156738 RepID=UPI0033A92F82